MKFLEDIDLGRRADLDLDESEGDSEDYGL